MEATGEVVARMSAKALDGNLAFSGDVVVGACKP